MRRVVPIVAALLVTAFAACTGTESRPADTPSPVAYVQGETTAPIQFTYYDDLVCDDCRQFSTAGAEQLRLKWVETGKLRLTVIDLAWHRGSVAGSAAAVCAAAQGKFWDMHELLFARQDQWKRDPDIPSTLRRYAAEMGLDTTIFAACAASHSHQQRLDAAEDDARMKGIRGTPAFFVNGKAYFGAQDWDWMNAVLTAYAEGTPEKAPPPPIKIPTKKVVDSVALLHLRDSLKQVPRRPKTP